MAFNRKLVLHDIGVVFGVILMIVGVLVFFYINIKLAIIIGSIARNNSDCDPGNYAYSGICNLTTGTVIILFSLLIIWGIYSLAKRWTR